MHGDKMTRGWHEDVYGYMDMNLDLDLVYGPPCSLLLIFDMIDRRSGHRNDPLINC